MAQTTNALRNRRTTWKPMWGASGSEFVLPLTNDVDPNITIVLDEITRGTTGKHVLGRWITAVNAMPKIQVADTTLVAMKKLCPWYSSGGTIPLVPETLVDIYDYAQPLTLHPNDMADATEDLIFNKAVPWTFFNPKRTGKADDVWEVTFHCFPDRALLTASTPRVVYGSIGAIIT